MSWFRSSRRRHSSDEPQGSLERPAERQLGDDQDARAPEPAPVTAPAFAAAELDGRPLADLHQLAAEARVPRYRLLRREQLVSALSGGDQATATAIPTPPPPPRSAPEPEPRRARPRPPARRPPPEPRQSRPQRGGERQRELEPEPEPERRTSFDDLPVRRPSRPLELGDALATRMVQLVAPLGRGQRALIAGPPGSGATALLREIARGLADGGVRATVVLVDVRPEEIPEWQDGVDVVAADSGSSPREQVELAERALEQAKRGAERGEDVVLVLDSLSRLARAYGLAQGTREEAVESAKRWFAAARDAGAGRGSLTLIAAARVESDSTFESLVHETLEDSASMVVRLSSELAARGMYPAIDADRSRTLGEEALLDDDRRRVLENLRGVARSLDPEEAWDFLAERAKEEA